jgi:bifunctional enzyme CysN/CysC
MTQPTPLDIASIEKKLISLQDKSLLRFITCGSVDDGKSTLIGRMLYESNALYEDQLKALEQDSKKVGTRGGKLDFALIVDGLSAEREQGITIDVAYRYFSTESRKFIIADTPGHEQYTRNMVTAASTAELAIVLVDATQGILSQTKRHSYLVSLMGINRVVLAVNKMDLIDFSQSRFEAIVQDYKKTIQDLPIKELISIPLCAVDGDNITQLSVRTPWFYGPTLMSYLEQAPNAENNLNQGPARLPIQWVNRPNQDFRGYTGTLASGTLRVGQAIEVMPSRQKTKIQSIAIGDQSMSVAITQQAITITLEDELDVSRGDVICSENELITQADQFEAKLVWLSEDTLYPGRSYLLKIGHQTVNASITKIKHQINVNNYETQAARSLSLNAIALCHLHTQKPILFEPYAENRHLGSFILIDKLTNNTVGAGLIDFPLHRSLNITTQIFEVNQASRASLKQQKPCVLWFTGMSGSGKSTIANLVEKALFQQGLHTYILDGDNVRQGLNKDLGFTEVDRIENVRRVAEVAKLMTDAGLIVMVTLISPYEKDRAFAKSLFETDAFIEIHIDANLNDLQKRDPKGLYQKVAKGEVKNFTGISAPYEVPRAPDIRIDTANCDPNQAAIAIMNYLKELIKI